MSNGSTDLLTQMQSNTYTVGDMYRRLGILRQCVEKALFTESEMSFLEECEMFLSGLDEKSDAKAIKVWGDTVFTSFTQNNISAKITALHAEIDMLPMLTLYIPVEFPVEEISMIGQWCRENVNPTLLIDVHIDPRAVGGCSFVWNDIHHDLSFRNQVRENKGVITDILSTYAKE